mgnify:CR=1 FL=1
MKLPQFTRWATLLLIGALAGLPAAQTAASEPWPTAFTYQGQLTQAGEPVSATCDLDFGLWDAASAGTLKGNQQLLAAEVVDGLFTAELDFGSAFTGSARWLALAVRCPAGIGEFTMLEPRQELTAAPYAQYAFSAPWAGLQGIPADLADGDQDTNYSAGVGLVLAGGEFGLATPYRLPQSCEAGKIAAWTGSAWACAPDQDTIYTAGAGLALADGVFSIPPGAITAEHLAPGAISASVVDTTTVQARVGGLCGEGEYVRQINVDGSVICGQDADTVLAAGDGLSLAGQTLVVDSTVARVADLPQLLGAAGYITTPLADERYSLRAGSGLARAGNTLSVLTTTIQARVTGVCSAGQYVRQVDADGSVVCGTDANSGGDITAVTAGAGLSGGATTGDASLALATSYRLPQSCAAGQVPVSDGAGGWTCQSPIPAGTIAFYAQTICPAGWSEVTALRGRAVVGLPAGGMVSATVGTALPNQGARTATLSVANLPAHTHDVDPAAVAASMAGDHSHSVDPAAVAATTNSGGAHTHTVTGGGGASGGSGHLEVYDGGSPYSAGSSAIGSAGSHTHSVTVDVPATTSTTAGGHSHAVDVGNTTSTATGGGTAFDVTMPYLQLLACSKN